MRCARVFNSGKAMAICISKEEAEKIGGVTYGDYLKVTTEDGKIIIEKIKE